MGTRIMFAQGAPDGIQSLILEHFSDFSDWIESAALEPEDWLLDSESVNFIRSFKKCWIPAEALQQLPLEPAEALLDHFYQYLDLNGIFQHLDTGMFYWHHYLACQPLLETHLPSTCLELWDYLLHGRSPFIPGGQPLKRNFSHHIGYWSVSETALMQLYIKRILAWLEKGQRGVLRQAQALNSEQSCQMAFQCLTQAIDQLPADHGLVMITA